MDPPQGDKFEKFEGSAQRVSAAEAMAEFVLLNAGEMAKDEESQQFESDVRQSNVGWKPGDVPRVPAGYRSGVAYRAALAGMARPVAAETRPREQRNGRPRERARGRSRVTRAGPSDDPDHALGPPPVCGRLGVA
jgi:hypothetical protein